MNNAQHSAETSEHYTPANIVRAARLTLDAFDLDPGSCAEANRTVRAANIYTEKDNGLSARNLWSGRLFVNPPGGCSKVDGAHAVCRHSVCTCDLVKRFWDKLQAEYMAGAVSAAIWIGFSVEQLQTLQAFDTTPLDFPICYPKKRIAFGGNSPTHANYIALLPSSQRQIMKFRRYFASVGQVVIPW